MNKHAIIGLGQIADAHATTLSYFGEKIIFVSSNYQKAQEMAKKYSGSDACADIDTALSDDTINSFIICLPNHMHAEIVCKAINSYKHVLVEKPLAHTLSDGEKIKICYQNIDPKKSLLMALQMNYAPFLFKVKKNLNKNHQYKYYFYEKQTMAPIDWRNDLKKSGGGVMLDLGIHYLSLAINIFGPVSEIRLKEQITGKESSVPIKETIEIKHLNGTEGKIMAQWQAEKNEKKIKIENDHLTIDYVPTSKLFKKNGVPKLVSFKSANGRKQMIKSYLDSIKNNKNINNLDEALALLKLIIEIKR